MRKDVRKQIRISSELLDYINDNFENASQFIREAIREKVEVEKKKSEKIQPFVEIRAKNQYTFSAELDRVIDGDTLLLKIDLGFFITINSKVRLDDINCSPVDTKKGQEAKAFIEKELTNANLILECRKKELYGRYLAYIYYSHDHDDFEGIIRHGKMINEELLKKGLAERC